MSPGFKYIMTIAAGIAVATTIGILTSVSPAHAQLRIQVDDGVRRAIPLAVPQPSGNESAVADKILEMVEGSLTSTGLLVVVPRRAHIEREVLLENPPRFRDWRVIDAQATLASRFERVGNQIRLSFRLWDTFGEKQVLAQSFTFSPGDSRRAAFKLADETRFNLFPQQ
jgi:TolB protein